MRPPEPLLAEGERLVEQDPPGADGGHDVTEDRPVEIVGHDHAVERAAPEGEGPACLEVALHDLEPVVTGEVGHPAGVPVDRRDPMAALEEEPGVAAATTGHVENRPSGRHQRGETGDPVGRRHRPEARPPNHRSHAGNIHATCRNMGPRS